MLKLIFNIAFISATLVILGCNEQARSNDQTQQQLSKLEIDSGKIYKDEAFKLLDEINNVVRKAIQGEVSQKDANDEIRPKMNKYNTIMNLLSPADTLELHNYRVEELIKIIDLHGEHNL